MPLHHVRYLDCEGLARSHTMLRARLLYDSNRLARCPVELALDAIFETQGLMLDAKVSDLDLEIERWRRDLDDGEGRRP